MTKEEIELLKSGQYQTCYPDITVGRILHDSAEYFRDHPDEKLIITCRWDELYNIWKLSATITDTGSGKTESKCTDSMSCVQQTSASDRKEPSLKHLLEKQSYVTPVDSQEHAHMDSTSLQHGDFDYRNIMYDPETGLFLKIVKTNIRKNVCLYDEESPINFIVFKGGYKYDNAGI